MSVYFMLNLIKDTISRMSDEVNVSTDGYQAIFLDSCIGKSRGGLSTLGAIRDILL
jgi:hypothetical protein